MTKQLADPILAFRMAKPGFVALHPSEPLLYVTTEGRERHAGAVAALRIM